MALIFWPPLLLTGMLEVIGGDPTVMQLIRTMASWPIEVEVKGAPQIKCHTRRSVVTSCGTQLRWEKKEWKRYVSQAWNTVPKVASSLGASFCLVLFFCFFWCSFFWLKVFFLLQRCLSSPLDSKLKLLSPFFCGLSCFWLSLSRVLCLTQAFPHPR